MKYDKTPRLVLWSIPLVLAVAVVAVILLLSRSDEDRFIAAVEKSEMVVFSEQHGTFIAIWDPDELDVQFRAAVEASLNLESLLDQKELPDATRAKLFALVLLDNPEVLFRESAVNDFLHTRESFKVLLTAANERLLEFAHLTPRVRSRAWELIGGLDFPEAKYWYAQHLYRQNDDAATAHLWAIVQNWNEFSGRAAGLLSYMPSETVAVVDALLNMLANAKEQDIVDIATSLGGVLKAGEDPAYYAAYRELSREDTPSARERLLEELLRIEKQWRSRQGE